MALRSKVAGTPRPPTAGAPRTRHRRMGVVGVLALVALVVAGLAPAYGSTYSLARASATSAHVTYLAGGHVASDRHYKPTALTLSGDSTLFIRHARWHVWNNRTASGSVSSGWNYCDPNCAAGPVKWFLARVTLSKPKYVCGHHFFTAVTFHFTRGRPKGIPQDDVFDATPAC